MVGEWMRAARGQGGRSRRADHDAERRQPAEGRHGPLPGAGPQRAGAVRADRGRRHRHPGRRSTSSSPTRRGRAVRGRLLVRHGRPAGDVHPRARDARRPRRARTVGDETHRAGAHQRHRRSSRNDHDTPSTEPTRRSRRDRARSTPRRTSRRPRPGWRVRRLAFDNIGAVYVWLAIIVGLLDLGAGARSRPSRPPSRSSTATRSPAWRRWPLRSRSRARIFDLSFAYVMSLSGVAVAHFVVGTTCRCCCAVALGARRRACSSA